jgi:NAD+ synthase
MLDIDLTVDLKEISIVIKDFIKTYVKNSGCKGVVIGLSGGVDSAVTAVLCKEALGKNNVKCLFLPDETTPKLDYKHHELFVKKFGLSCEKKDITKVVKELTLHSITKPNKYALANIKARARMILLFEYANMANYLVCGTSNKSEILVGYYTKYGDGGVDLMPIGDLYKTQVWEFAKFLKIPKEIISKPPTAGLWAGQFDEQELKMGYNKLDLILAGLERKIDIDEIARIANVNKSDVERIKQMRIKSEHKRRAALIPKVGLRTLKISIYAYFKMSFCIYLKILLRILKNIYLDMS